MNRVGAHLIQSVHKVLLSRFTPINIFQAYVEDLREPLQDAGQLFRPGLSRGDGGGRPSRGAKRVLGRGGGSGDRGGAGDVREHHIGGHTGQEGDEELLQSAPGSAGSLRQYLPGKLTKTLICATETSREAFK